MPSLEVVMYQSSGKSPVADFLRELAEKDAGTYTRLRIDLQTLGAEGMRSSKIDVRSLGDGLWELKRLSRGVQYRIVFCLVDGAAWLLHAFETKTPRTPLRDIRLAQARMRRVSS